MKDNWKGLKVIPFQKTTGSPDDFDEWLQDHTAGIVPFFKKYGYLVVSEDRGYELNLATCVGQGGWCFRRDDVHIMQEKRLSL